MPVMRKPLVLALPLLAALTVLPAAAIPGTPDRVPAASLLVPFFETGIDVATHPHDTIMIVTNRLGVPVTFHYHVWDIDGTATALSGNVTLAARDSWSAAMRDLIAPASAAIKTALTEATFFYRGFLTIDMVTAATAQNPLQGTFPFDGDNALEGFIYYTRLAEGSANGLAMVPLEAVAGSVNSLLRDFYAGGGLREEIDADARLCAQQLASGVACTGNANDVIDRIQLRHFGSVPLNGRSRLIIFTWNTFSTGAGPSVLCGGGACATDYTARRYDENGTTLNDATIRLDHVVNVIEVTATQPGWVEIFNVPSFNNDLQVYAFSFNSAHPTGNPNLTWDAIFEAFIVP
jgi:hypothetical protein